MEAGPAAGPRAVWDSLDPAWRAAFGQAWEALRTGNIPVGACVTTPDGELLHAARNRVHDRTGPPGQVWGTSLAHAEVNALARVGYGRQRDLVLTTTLEPCLQCAAAIRLSPVARVRFAGADTYWQGCHDFARMSAREAARVQPVRLGPRADELGLFATVLTRTAAGLTPRFEAWLRSTGEAPVVDLAARWSAGGRLSRLAEGDLVDALEELWADLTLLRARLGGPAPA